MQKILIASDHAGFLLKDFLIKKLKNKFEFKDLGTTGTDSVDYPDYAHKLSEKISKKKFSHGILICGSGIGMSMVANRYSNVRAALCIDEKMAKLAKEHNNANILVLGSRLISKEEAIKCLMMFFNTNFEGDRHQARLDKFNNVKI
tara:strand:+ start:565 stop:1002 length:438 start_codon:yes stop_codon:yes gene_type:complete